MLHVHDIFNTVEHQIIFYIKFSCYFAKKNKFVKIEYCEKWKGDFPLSSGAKIKSIPSMVVE